MNSPAQTPSVREVPFNALPEPTRERLVAVLGKRGGPQPIYENPQGKGGVVGFIFLALFGGLGLLGLMAVDFGGGSRFHQDAPFIAGYAAMILFFLWGVLGAIKRILLLRAVPFRPGVYLFATELVDATDPVLKLWPLAAMKTMNCVHHHTNGVYTNSLTTLHFPKKSYSFSVRGKAAAEAKLQELNGQRRALAMAAQNNAADQLYERDVFFEARMSPIWSDPAAAASAAKSVHGSQQARSMPGFLKRAGLLSLGLALLGCVPTWFVRNQASDEAAFRTLRTYYHATNYIRRDGNHAETVRTEILPRLAFERAQGRGTVTALREFLTEFGATSYAEPARQAIHAHYERVKAVFLQQANTQDTRMVGFMTSLLAWLENNGSPPVNVHYAPPGAAALLELDSRLAANANRVNGRPIAPIAPHFAPQFAESREQIVTRALQNGFGAVFPGEILELHGSHGPDSLAAAAGVSAAAPSIHVAYVVRPSGSTYSSDHDPADFVGIHVDFVVTMSVPGQAPYSFNVGVEPPEHFSVRRDATAVVVPGGTAGRVYAEMARRAFDRLGASMAQTFFRPGTPAFQQATSGATR